MELTLGVPGRSRKENERRVPLHPDHFEAIPRSLRRRIVLERGYGEAYGVSDLELESLDALLKKNLKHPNQRKSQRKNLNQNQNLKRRKNLQKRKLRKNNQNKRKSQKRNLKKRKRVKRSETQTN